MAHPIVVGFLIFVIFACAGFVMYFVGQYNTVTVNYVATSTPVVVIPPPTLNKALYDEKLAYIARPLWLNLQMEASTTPLIPALSTTTTATTTTIATTTKNKVLKKIATSSLGSSSATSSMATSTPPLWPVKTVYPNYGALLPFNRIIAYYGNFYTGQLGILGQEPPQQMLTMLMGEVAKWQAADPKTPVIPAIDYIAITAQGSPGPDGKYRARMPADQIQKAVDLANQINGIVILDIQVGLSNVQTEIPLLEPYLKLPNVELALDPEFSMKTGARPGTVIGSMDASDINFTANYLAKIVDKNKLPPKVLIVHRFTEGMVTNTQDITPLPEVQIVMDMDGFGTPAQKTKIYKQIVADFPVQFTGLKLFYKNDIAAPSTGLMTDNQILNLTPEPSFIQYQ